MYDTIFIGNTQNTLKTLFIFISPIYNVYSKMDKNQTHLSPTLDSTLTIPHHVRIYVSV